MADTSILDEFRSSARSFAEREIAPHAERYDRESAYPEESVAAARRAGFLTLFYPADHGGDGADLLTQAIFVEEIARVCASSALTLFSAPGILKLPMQHGPEELAAELVPQAIDGNLTCSFCLTEPDAGTDLKSITTRAKATDDGWVLNGRKQFITNAGRSDWYSVLAKTAEGFGVFFVHKDDPGFAVDRIDRKMGHRGSPTGSLVFDDCTVTGGRVIGDPSLGLLYIDDILVWSRALIAAQALGIAQGALDEALDYTAERRAFGRTVSDFQMTRGMVADMAIAIEAARRLLYHVAELWEAGGVEARDRVAMAKVACSNAAMQVTTDAVQLFGGSGYIEGTPVERMMRDAKITQIWEGTNQINRLIVAKALYGARRRGTATR